MHKVMAPQRRTRRPAIAAKNERGERGITLLESLISIVVLGVAVLGILGTQLRTMAETQTSARRAQVVRVIEDLAERIRSNPGGFSQLQGYEVDWDAPMVEPASACRATPCTPAQLAARDIWEWKTAVAQRLPQGRARVFTSSDEDADGKRQLGVMVGWRANERRREGENDDDHQAYVRPFAMPATTGAANVACPDGLVCHLVYVQP